MKRLLITALLVTVGLSTFAQWDVRNKIFRQIANGDTIITRIWDGYDTYDGSNPIHINYYDSTAFVGSRGMGVTKFLSYGSAKFYANTYIGNAVTDTLFFQNTDTITGITDLSGITGNVGNSTTSVDTVFANVTYYGSLGIVGDSRNFTDDESLNLTADIGGWLYLWSEDNDWGMFAFKKDGTITLMTSNGNVAATDSDTDLCAFDGGTYITIRNRLGGTKQISYEIHFAE